MVSDEKNTSAENQSRGIEKFNPQDDKTSNPTTGFSKIENDETDTQISQTGNDTKREFPNDQIADRGMRTDLSELDNNNNSYPLPSPPQDIGMQAVFPIIPDDDLNVKQVSSNVEIAKPPPEAMQGAPEPIREYPDESRLPGSPDPIRVEQNGGK